MTFRTSVKDLVLVVVVQVRMQSASDATYSRRKSCAKYFQQIYREEGVHGLYRVSHYSSSLYYVPSFYVSLSGL